MPGYVLRVSPERAVSDPLWQALRRAAEPATIVDLHRASRAHPNAIQNRLRRWRRVGFVAMIPAEPSRYAISPAAAHQVGAPTDGTLSDDAWSALRRLGRAATFAEILAASGASDRPLYCRLRRWKNAGYVVEIKGKPKRFALAPEAPDVALPPRVSIDGRVKPRRSARDRMWKAMRVLKQFDVPMLVMTAEVSRRAAEDFINLLSRAGYVQLVGHGCRRRAQGNLEFARDWSSYRLVRSTGPNCPKITNPASGNRELVDPNTGQAVPINASVVRRERGVNHDR